MAHTGGHPDLARLASQTDPQRAMNSEHDAASTEGRVLYDVIPFRPAGWLRAAHAQTIAGKLLRPAVDVPLRRERVGTPDGDFLDLDFTVGDDTLPLVVAMHGLEGSARRRYMLLSYDALRRRGLEAVGLNLRGCSGEPNRTARAYHSGETGDLRLVLALLRERFPERPLGAMGFSLGGNALLKYLGEVGESAAVGAAAVVSVPFDLEAGARAIGSGVFGRWLYTTYFMRSLKRKTEARSELVAEHCDLDAVRASRTLLEFDDAATAPLHGFADAVDYYTRSSSARFLPGIRVPTLVLHARDDPFLPEACIPVETIASNPYLVGGIVDRGGHAGFITGAPGHGRFWADQEAARFLATNLA